MKKILILITAIFFPLNLLAGEVTPLAKSSTSWDGDPLSYPKGEAEINAIKIILKPGEAMPFHCHTMPTVGYVISGTLVVEKKSGEKHTFHAGDTINEVVKTWHRGINPSDKETMELVGFYIGVRGTPTTIAYSEATKDACK